MISPFAGRPAPWALPPEGFHFEAVEQDDRWVTPPRGAGRCRWMIGRKACGAKPVASVMRGFGGYGPRPWDYCAEHLYGRWIEDGKVMGWRLRRDDSDA